jgi:hypothetical protein
MLAARIAIGVTFGAVSLIEAATAPAGCGKACWLHPTGSNASVHFEPPVLVGHHFFWANGVVGFGDDKTAIGQGEGSTFFTTVDAGATWSAVQISSGCRGGAPAPQTEATVLSQDGKSLHDVSSVASTSKGLNATAFNASTSCCFTRHSNGSVSAGVRDTPIVFSGLPKPATGFRTDGRGYVKLPDGTLVMSIEVNWGVVAYTSSDGFMWRYIGTILLAADAHDSEEGPNENDLALLSDGSIICVIRLDAGDGRKSLPPDMQPHHFLPYVKVVSSDGGKTWSKAVSLVDTRGMIMGCARPRLLGFQGSGMVLSGGRLNRTNHENYLWVNAAGDGVAWEAISISYVHNTLEPNSTLKFGASVNESNARVSTSYTSLVKTGARRGFVVYSRLLPSPSAAFALRFELE